MVSMDPFRSSVCQQRNSTGDSAGCHCITVCHFITACYFIAVCHFIAACVSDVAQARRLPAIPSFLMPWVKG